MGDYRIAPGAMGGNESTDEHCPKCPIAPKTHTRKEKDTVS